MIRFTAHGDPKGQPRPRAFAFHGRARVFDPGTAEGWKGAVAVAARPALPAEPLDGPVSVSLTFRFGRPKAHFTKKGLRPTAPTWQTGKPDSDNAAKAVLDALTTLGAWKDDAQVCRLIVTKAYGDVPGCDVEIETLTGGTT